MPKRSNEFQRLIAAIQSHLDSGSTVVESDMRPDAVTGTPREADIVVSGKVGGQPVTVSIECRDRKRAADVSWVDEMRAKHSRLATNVLVLVSHNGFSQEALRVARLYDIRCLEFADIDSDAPERIFPNVKSLWGKSWSATIERVEVFVEASDGLPAEWFRATPDHNVFNESGEQCAEMVQIANALINTEQAKEKMFRDAQPDHTFLELEWERPYVEGTRLCVQKIDPPSLRPIERLRVVGRCVVMVEEFPLRHGLLKDVRVAYGTVPILGQPALFLATSIADEEPKVSLRLSQGEGAS